MTPVTIIGHSLGGSISLNYTGLYPETVVKLVAIEGMGPPPHMMKMFCRTAHARTHSRMGQRPTQDGGPHTAALCVLEEAFQRMQEENPHLSADQARHLTIHGSNQNEDGTYSWKFDNYVRAFFPVGLSPNQSDELYATHHLPHTIGPRHRIVGVRSAKRTVARRHSRTFASRTSSGAGHWVHHDQLDEFLRHRAQIPRRIAAAAGERAHPTRRTAPRITVQRRGGCNRRRNAVVGRSADGAGCIRNRARRTRALLRTRRSPNSSVPRLNRRAACRPPATSRWRAFSARRLLVTDDLQHRFGFGCTASLATQTPKRGEHRAHIALQTLSETRTWSITFAKGARDRARRRTPDSPTLRSLRSPRPFDCTQRIPFDLRARRRRSTATARPRPADWGDVLLGFVRATPVHQSAPPTVLFPGAFNPLHDGHHAMARHAEAVLRRAGCVRNLRQQCRQAAIELSGAPAPRQPVRCVDAGVDHQYGDIRREGALLSRRSHSSSASIRSSESASRSTTAAIRCAWIQPLAKSVTLGCRFLVFGRTIDGRFTDWTT